MKGRYFVYKKLINLISYWDGDNLTVDQRHVHYFDKLSAAESVKIQLEEVDGMTYYVGVMYGFPNFGSLGCLSRAMLNETRAYSVMGDENNLVSKVSTMHSCLGGIKSILKNPEDLNIARNQLLRLAALSLDAIDFIDKNKEEL